MLSVGAVTSNLNVVTKTGNYTAAPNDFVLVDATTAGVTITLPAGPPLNTLIAVKKTDASTSLVTVVPGAGANIQGDTGMGLVAKGASVTVQYDGTNWQVLSTAVYNAANAAAGMPTGGAAGQTLVKTSAANYDAAWSTPAGTSTADVMLAPTSYRSGYWYDRRTGTNNSPALVVSGNSVSSNTITYVPQYLHSSVTINAVAMGSGTATPASASTIQIAAYTCTTVGLPGTLIASLGTLTMPATASTLVKLTVANQVLPKGWMYWAFLPSVSYPCVGFNASALPYPAPGVPDAYFVTSVAITTSAAPPGLVQPYQSATTFPATAGPDTTSYQAATNLSANIWFKIA